LKVAVDVFTESRWSLSGKTNDRQSYKSVKVTRKKSSLQQMRTHAVWRRTITS
jgi:hypothetical protein